MLNLTATEAKGLKIKEVKTLRATIDKGTAVIESATEKRFTDSLSLAATVLDAAAFLSSPIGKEMFKREKLNMDEFVPAAYGFEKPFFYKLKKAGETAKNAPDVLQAFREKVAAEKAKGNAASLSIEALNKFASDLKAPKETADGETGDGETAAPKKNGKLVLTLSGLENLPTVSMRIGNDGQLKTTNSIEELHAAVRYLAEKIGLQTKEAAEKPAPKKAAKGKKTAVSILDVDGAFRSEIVDLSEHA